MFKESFKYYKSKSNPPDLATVIDLRQPIGDDSAVSKTYHIY